MVYKQRSPVAIMDSVDALDLLDQVWEILRTGKTASLDLIARIKEQRYRHQWALRRVIEDDTAAGVLATIRRIRCKLCGSFTRGEDHGKLR